MKVLVCGGRDFDNLGLLSDTLIRLSRERAPIERIIAGGARGADRLAEEWADIWIVPIDVFRADWLRHGRAAGPIRNQRMLEEGKPDLVLAFPGGRGTADMVSRARKAGVEVIEIAASGSVSS